MLKFVKGKFDSEKIVDINLEISQFENIRI